MGTERAELSLDEVAAGAGLHPFDVARVLGHMGELPPGLHFTGADVGRVRHLAGVERWWEDTPALPAADPARSHALAGLLARRILERDLTGDRTTRADNLFRGLPVPDRRRLRKLVNRLIVARLLHTRSSWRGLQVAVDPAQLDALRRLARGEAVDDVLASVGASGGWP